MPAASGTLRPVSTEWFEALRAADPAAPSSLETFDRIARSGELRPDLYEHSVRVASRVSPHRLTYYFDTHRRGASVAREAGERFVHLSAGLGLRVPPRLAAFVRSDAPAGDEVLQVVLGVDASPEGAGLRVKYYLVFRDHPSACVAELLRAVDLAPAPGTDPDKTYIVGVDVTSGGVHDVKLYFRLEASRVPKVIGNAEAVADLLGASGDVVFQQCTRRPERRQVYVHTKSTVSLSAWLARHGFDEALGRAKSINARLSGARIEPRIVSFAYADGRVDLGAACVYFHLA
jgi:hypothetical protein